MRELKRLRRGSRRRALGGPLAWGIDVLEQRVLLAVDIHVDASSPGPAHDGTSWATAYADLQQALAAAAGGDRVLIAKGTYKPTDTTDRAISFQLKNGVEILGGYAGYGASVPDARDVAAYPTILSGDIGVQGDNKDNAYQVVTSNGNDSTTVLDGVTITAGYGHSNQYVGDRDRGGGMRNISSSPTVRNCTFIANSAEYGGGMFNKDHSSPTVIDCKFIGNFASDGGGMRNESSSPTLIDCTFRRNSADYGGGVYAADSSSLTLTNCVFTGNSAKESGGGVFIPSGSLSNCIFVGNSARSAGGGMLGNAVLVNCTFTANSGGGIYTASSTLTLTNCVVWNNPDLKNPDLASSNGSPSVTYSDIGGGWAGTGNINADPLFVRNPSPGADATWGTADDDYGDLRLLACSPVVDAGNNAAVPAGTVLDLGGNNRFLDVPTTPDTGSGTAPIVDMGAYEAVAALSASAGGPYRVLEGQSVTLDGRGSSVAPGALSYAWEWSGDGQYDEATGTNPVFSTNGLAPGVVTVSIRVTDAVAQSIIGSSTVMIVPRVLYVDASATGSGNGTNWANAYTSLADALNIALAGCEIRVAAGTYWPTATANREASFLMKNGVTILGGYAGYGASDPDARDVTAYPTILSGDIGVAGDKSDNSFHVVMSVNNDATAVLDGVSIVAGNTSRGAVATGGGVYAYLSSATFRNCILSGNSASRGGGMYTEGNPSPTLINCTFVRNQADGGGGMGTGANSSPTLINCTFAGNQGNGMSTAGSPLLVNCVFVGNSAESGGGMSIATYGTTLVNCTFTGNTASYQGGALWFGEHADPKMYNCLFWGNTAPTAPPVYHIPMLGDNGVVWYVDVTGPWVGTGIENGNVDPLFFREPSPGADGVWGTADDDYGDLRISPASRAVDAGNNADVPAGITTDLAGNPRFLDVPTTPDTGSGTPPVVDMGAYEAVPGLAADAGGPYTTLQGNSITLSGRGASDMAGPLTYTWEWTGDGQFDDASGQSPVFSTVGFSTGPVTVLLRVTDAAGQNLFGRTTINILPKVVCVDVNAPGVGNGWDWVNAITSLAAALKVAVPGQEIHVADGVYKPTDTTDRKASFQLQNNVTILGGYAGYGASDPNARDVRAFPTILSGDIGTPGDTSDNSYHVVTSPDNNTTAVLDGFTITAGYASGVTAERQTSGGGLYVTGSSSPRISNCTFSGNTALASSYYAVGLGGGLGGEGGGVYAADSSTPTLINCVFFGNRATIAGGGMSAADSAAPVLVNCAFVGNIADQTSVASESVFWAGGTGGGINVRDTAAATLINCTFSGNTAAVQGGGVYVAHTQGVTAIAETQLFNCIVWNNTAPQAPQIAIFNSAPVIAYSDVQGGWAGEGNINADPLFVRNPAPGADGAWGTADDDPGDVHLQDGSPCVDAGSNSAVAGAVSVDLDGQPRIVDIPGAHDPGAIADMGVFERQTGGTTGDLPAPAVVSPLKLGVRTLSGGRTRLLWIYRSRSKRKIGYFVERSADGVHFTRVAKLAGAPRQTFIDAGLKKNHNYIYRIRAFAKGMRPVWSESLAIRARG